MLLKKDWQVGTCDKTTLKVIFYLKFPFVLSATAKAASFSLKILVFVLSEWKSFRLYQFSEIVMFIEHSTEML